MVYHASGTGTTEAQYKATAHHLFDGTAMATPTGRTASYVIAASNSRATERAQADVVCDGTADNVEIQAALTAGNTHIVFSSGTFNIATAIVPINYAIFEGQSWSTIFQASGNNDIFADTSAPHFIGVVWKNIKFASDRTKTGTAINVAEYGSNCIVDNCWFNQWLHPAVILDYTWGFNFNSCLFDYCGNVTGSTGAVQLNQTADSGNTNTTFIKCIFEPNYYADIDIGANAIVDHLSIQDCWFESDSAYGTGFYSHIYGRTGSDLYNLNISNSRFAQDNGADTANFINVPEINNGIIHGNNFTQTSPSTAQMIVVPNLNCAITDNTFIVCSGTGIYNNTQGTATISGNHFTFWTSTGTGIYLESGNSQVVNNEITGGNIGIFANYDLYCVFSGNTFNGCTYGIQQAYGGAHALIINNSFQSVGTPIQASVNDTVRSNVGYNPVGKVTSPVGTSTIGGLGGSGSTVTSATVYTVTGVDCLITSTGGTVTNIVIKDAAGNTRKTGVTTLDNQLVFVGESVTWTHTGAPTVTVFGN